MELAFHRTGNAPEHPVEIVVHITEALDERQRGQLVATLNDHTGIVAAEFCPLRNHLMLVRYDRGVYASRDVLARVEAQHVTARLIGPV